MLRQGGKSTSTTSQGRRKVHTEFEDGSELVEEYDETNGNLIVRRRRRRDELGKVGEWEYLVGDPPRQGFDPTQELIAESPENPLLSRQDTSRDFVWRIRNLPYAKSNFDVSIDHADQAIVVRTSNKKYYKRIRIPELEAVGKHMEDERLRWDHANSTLVIGYRKPAEVIQAEEEDRKDALQRRSDSDVDCKQQ